MFLVDDGTKEEDTGLVLACVEEEAVVWRTMGMLTVLTDVTA
jgi:hypothetical protein